MLFSFLVDTQYQSRHSFRLLHCANLIIILTFVLSITGCCGDSEQYNYWIKGSIFNVIWKELETLIDKQVMSFWLNSEMVYLVSVLLGVFSLLYVCLLLIFRTYRFSQRTNLLEKIIAERTQELYQQKRKFEQLLSIRDRGHDNQLLTTLVNKQADQTGINRIETERYFPEKHKFIKRLNLELSKNFQNADFNVTSLAKNMFMTRQQLARKVKALLTMQPSDYLWNYRLEKSLLLLKQGICVGDVAFMVGYATHSSFTQSFKAKYGTAPSDISTKNKHSLGIN